MKARTRRRSGCGIFQFFCCSCRCFKRRQINVKMRFHPARLSDRRAPNEIRGCPVKLGWQGQPLPPSTAQNAVQTLSLPTCPVAWRTAGIATVYCPPRPVDETRWNDSVSIVSSIVRWHFTRQLETFHLVHLEGYILVHILTTRVEKQIKEKYTKGQKTSGKIG